MTIIYILVFAGAAFGAGFYAGVKNANSSKVNKAKDIVDLLNR